MYQLKFLVDDRIFYIIMKMRSTAAKLNNTKTTSFNTLLSWLFSEVYIECRKHMCRRVKKAVIIREILQDNYVKLSFVDVAALSRSASDFCNNIQINVSIFRLVD